MGFKKLFSVFHRSLLLSMFFSFGAAADLVEYKITMDDATGEDHFGRAMAVSGDRVVVGAMTHLDGEGAVYIYRLSDGDWLPDHKISGGASGGFGRSVDIDGNYLVVAQCSTLENGSCDPSLGGLASIYHRDDSGLWILQSELEQPGLPFGTSVAISGDSVVIGADGGEGASADVGSAYIYRRDGENWVEEAKLVADDGVAGDSFAFSSAISGDYAVIGAWNAMDSQGAAYIFERNGGAWLQTAKLIADDGATGDQFGSWFIDIDGDYAVVGALNDDDQATNSGSAYIFNRAGDGTWSQQAKLLPSISGNGDRFGTSTAISGDYALIGSFKGAYAFIFKRDGTEWLESHAFTSSDYVVGDDFAYALALDGGIAAIGADDAITDGTETGAAYVYTGFESLDLVSDIPDQNIVEGESFATIRLDDFVSHDDYLDEEMTWTATGQVELEVNIDSNRIATITPLAGWTGSETVTFEATAPDGDKDSDEASFIVQDPTAVAPSDLNVSFSGTEATLTWTGEATDISCTSLTDTVTGTSYTISFPDDVGFMDPQICSVSNAAGSSNETGTFGCLNATTCRINPPIVDPGPNFEVTDIANQTISEGDSFATITLDDFVSHDDYLDEEMTWTATGQVELEVNIDSNRIATITPLAGWTGSETVTFEATAPDGDKDSDEASFTVQDPTAVAPSDLGVSFSGTEATLTWTGEATDISCTSLTDTVTGSNYTISFPDDVGFMDPQICSVSNAAGSSNETGTFGCLNATTCRVNQP